MPPMTTRRKLAIATWSPPAEGNIFGKLTLDATRALAWLDEVRARTGEKVTITAFIGRALGEALQRVPTLNGRIRMGVYIPHETVDVTFLVSTEDGKDLAKVKVRDADKKSVSDIARELREAAGRVRKGEDEAFEKSKGVLRALPTWLIRPLLSVSGWLSGSMGVELKALGLERFPFGSCVVTNVGMFGLDEGYAPFTPFAHVPLLVLVGALRDAPTVKEGQVVVQKQITLTATIDHRFIDGFQGGILARTVREIFEDPWQLDRKPAE